MIMHLIMSFYNIIMLGRGAKPYTIYSNCYEFKGRVLLYSCCNECIMMVIIIIIVMFARNNSTHTRW